MQAHDAQVCGWRKLHLFKANSKHKSTTMKSKFALFIVLGWCFSWPLAAISADLPNAQPSPNASQVASIDPTAEKLLESACKAITSANAFTFHAEVLFDHVLPSNVKVQFAAEMKFVLQRPGELMVDYHSDLGAKQLWYRNGTLTIYDPPHSVYSTIAVPDSIDAMLEQVAKTQNLSIPLSNLAYSDLCERLHRQIIYGAYIGVNDVNGVECDHLAFSSSTADLQVWLDRSGKPLPRKVVINYRSEPSSPEYIATLSDWKFPAQIASSEFEPHMPKSAKQIEFITAKEVRK